MISEIAELGYVTVGVADRQAFKNFATEVVGCQVAADNDRETLLRNDWCAYRIRVLDDDINDVLAVGWCVPSKMLLDAAAARLERHGVTFRWGRPEEAAERKVQHLIFVKDPEGINLELFSGLRIDPARPFHSPLPISGFVTGDEGMGHIGLWTSDLERSVAFYRDVLGMRITDRAEGALVNAAFLRFNRRQHGLALVQAPSGFSQYLHHIEFEMRELDDVGRAYDKATDRDILMTTLGKHPAEQALSFYMYTPAGFAFELSLGGIKIADDDVPETWHDDTAFWGHRYVGPFKK